MFRFGIVCIFQNALQPVRNIPPSSEVLILCREPIDLGDIIYVTNDGKLAHSEHETNAYGNWLATAEAAKAARIDADGYITGCSCGDREKKFGLTLPGHADENGVKELMCENGKLVYNKYGEKKDVILNGNNGAISRKQNLLF